MYGQRTRSCQSILIRHPSQTSRYYTSSSRKVSPRPKPPESKTFFEKTEKLVIRAAEPPIGWKTTPSLRGEQKRLRASIKTIKDGSRPPSLEKMAFTSGELSFGEGENSELVIEPGSFVELRKKQVTMNAINIGQEYVDRDLNYISIVHTGEIWRHSKDDVLFDVPHLISTDLATRCGTNEVTTNNHELNARIQVLKRLREIQKSVENAGLLIASKNLDIYSIVKASEPTEWGSTTVAEVARLLVAKPTLSHIFAAHKYLIASPSKFLVSHDYAMSRRFRVRPKVALDRIETIGAWIKAKDERLNSFVSKVKAILGSNRGVSLLYSRGLPERAMASHSWNDDDKLILQFLLDTLRPSRLSQVDPSVVSQSHILRPFLTEDQDVADEHVHQLLVDLGVIAPWQDLSELREELDCDVDGSRMEKANQLALRAYSSRPAPGQPLGPEDFYPSDPCESVRHDFGDLPVYVIDEVTAKELDDGISVESVPSEPDNFWVHVHVADPTSVLPPTHVFARQAQDMTDSLYYYQATYPMLPPALTHDPAQGMSLGSIEPGKAQSVLTFSTKVNSNGDITDYKVRAGLVRNIIVTSYASVDAALGSTFIHHTYPFGHTPAVEHVNSHPESHIKDFRLLDSVRRNFIDRRMKDGVFNHSHIKAELYDIKWPSFHAHPTMEPTRFSGFPDMKYRVTTTGEQDVGARSIVAEMMKLASRAASIFCRDRDLPMIRRFATRPTLVSQSALQDLLSARTAHGYLTFAQTYPYMVSGSVAGYSTDMKGHFGLGVPDNEGYVRATSPLRRYGDLIAHWQIHSVLQGRKPVFSLEWLKDFSIKFQAKERLRRRAQGLHEAFWHTYFVKRFMEEVKSGLHAESPNPLFGLVARTAGPPEINRDSKKFVVDSDLESLGIKTVVSGVGSKEMPPGTLIPVEVGAIRLGVRPQIQVVPRT